MTAISPDRIRQIEARRDDELAALMASGELAGDRFVAVSKEYAELEPVAEAAADVRRLRQEADSLRYMTQDADADLRAMAAEELRDNEAKLAEADRPPRARAVAARRRRRARGDAGNSRRHRR